MPRAIKNIIFLACMVFILGCETFRGALQDIANTASNIREIFTTGKTISDATK